MLQNIYQKCVKYKCYSLISSEIFIFFLPSKQILFPFAIFMALGLISINNGNNNENVCLVAYFFCKSWCLTSELHVSWKKEDLSDGAFFSVLIPFCFRKNDYIILVFIE